MQVWDCKQNIRESRRGDRRKVKGEKEGKRGLGQKKKKTTAR
jgi:hypothetical protein